MTTQTMAPARCRRCGGSMRYDPVDDERWCINCGARAYKTPPLEYLAPSRIPKRKVEVDMTPVVDKREMPSLREYIADHPGLTAQEIALGIDRTRKNVVKKLSHLHRQGYLRRTEKGRKPNNLYRWYLKEEGKE